MVPGTTHLQYVVRKRNLGASWIFTWEGVRFTQLSSTTAPVFMISSTPEPWFLIAHNAGECLIL